MLALFFCLSLLRKCVNFRVCVQGKPRDAGSVGTRDTLTTTMAQSQMHGPCEMFAWWWKKKRQIWFTRHVQRDLNQLSHSLVQVPTSTLFGRLLALLVCLLFALLFLSFLHCTLFFGCAPFLLLNLNLGQTPFSLLCRQFRIKLRLRRHLRVPSRESCTLWYTSPTPT